MWKATGTVTLPAGIRGCGLTLSLSLSLPLPLGARNGSLAFGLRVRASADASMHAVDVPVAEAPESATVADAIGVPPAARRAPAAAAARTERVCKRMEGGRFLEATGCGAGAT